MVVFTLRRLLWENQRVSTFTLSLPTYDSSFAHPHVSPLPVHKSSSTYAARTRDLIQNPDPHTLSLFILESNTDNSYFHTAWLLYHSHALVDSGVACEHSRIGALLSAMAAGLEMVSHDTHALLYIFLPSSIPGPYLLQGHKHPYLHFSVHIISSVSWLVLGAPGFRATFCWFSLAWATVQCLILNMHPLFSDPEDVTPLASVPDRKADMYSAWATQYVATPHPQTYYRSCAPPNGNQPPQGGGGTRIPDLM
jgi:hypothetical protein